MNPYWSLFEDILKKCGNAIMVALPDYPNDHQRYVQDLPGYSVVPMQEILQQTARIDGPLGLLVTNFNNPWIPDTSWRNQPVWHIQNWIYQIVSNTRKKNPNFVCLVLSKGLVNPKMLVHPRMPFNQGVLNFERAGCLWQMTPRGGLLRMKIITVEPDGTNPRHLEWRSED